VVAVNIINFQFSAAFDTAIEEKVKAEQEAFTEQNRLEKVKFQAQQKVEQARGEAESTLLKAEAEAEANTIISQSLTEQLVRYKGLEKWNGTLPTVTSEAGVILQGEF
jgi:regulator of protease activity HflC (stomatin/prohibitin superfamily)